MLVVYMLTFKFLFEARARLAASMSEQDLIMVVVGWALFFASFFALPHKFSELNIDTTAYNGPEDGDER